MRISGLSLEHNARFNQSSTSQSVCSASGTPAADKDSQVELDSGKEYTRQAKFCSICGPPGSPSHKKAAEGKSSSSCWAPESKTTDSETCPARNKLVVKTSEPVLEVVPSKAGYFHEHGCLSGGLGRSDRGILYKRKMVSSGTWLAHKSQRADVSLPGDSQVIELPGEPDDSPAVGQSHGHRLYPKRGRDEIKTADQFDICFSEFVPVEKNSSSPLLLARDSERHCR